MYYVIVFLALIVVMGVLIVLRAVASDPQDDEPEQVEQSEMQAKDTVQAESSPAAVVEEQERPGVQPMSRQSFPPL